MKTSLLSVAAIALALSTGSALAADLPYRKEAPPPVYIAPAPVATWTGFYGGLNIGGGWASNGGIDGLLGLTLITRYPIGAHRRPATRPSVPTCSSSPAAELPLGNPGGVVGGAQVGYNYQFNSVRDRRRDRLPGHQHHGGSQGNYVGLYDSSYPTFDSNPANNYTASRWRR